MPSYSGFIIFTYTGEGLYAGTNNPVYIILHGDDGKSSKAIALNDTFGSKFSSEKVDTFRLSNEAIGDLGRDANIERLEVWKENTFGLLSNDWFVDKIVVENTCTNSTYVFPMFRWIKSGHRYNIKHLNTSLPQFDEFPEQRKMELEDKKKTYVYDQKIPNGPVQVKILPVDEQFSFDYKLDIMALKFRLKFYSVIAKIFQRKWTCLEDFNSVYDGENYAKPKNTQRWNSDIEFGRQRIAGINPILIFLLTKIPENFPVTDDLVKPLLEGLTIEEAIHAKRLFMCDLKIMEGIPHRHGTSLCSPLAMFYVNNKNQLLPVAIQLFQQPGPNNPVQLKYIYIWVILSQPCTFHNIVPKF